MSPLLAVTLLAVMARPPTYGGEVVSFVYGEPVVTDPAMARTAADSAAHAAAYERLYVAHGGTLTPVVARDVPQLEDAEVIVPLRRDIVLHDGRPLSPALAVEALQRMADEARAAYVLTPVQRAGGRPSIRTDDELHAVRFQLARPDPGFPYLLAADHARLAWPQRDGPLVGTGPFRWIDARSQGPFLHHRDGRPFVDRLEWRPYASRFGATSLAERGAVPVYGVPQPPRALTGPGTWIVLQVSPKIGGPPQRDALRAQVSAALTRSRIARRYLGAKDAPATGFIATPAAESSSRASGGRKLELLAAQRLRFGHRLVERIQLDLFRAGLRAEIRWVELGELDARSERGDYDLRLFELRPGVIDDGTSRASLHRLLSAAAALGVSAAVDDERLARFAQADEAGRQRVLQEIEQRVRSASGAVVVARLVPAFALPTGWTTAPQGGVDWADLIWQPQR